MKSMSLERFIHVFEAAIEAVEPGTVSANTRYKELKAWDSLAILTVTDAVEMEYGVLLGKKDFESAETVADLYRSIQKQNGAKL